MGTQLFLLNWWCWFKMHWNQSDSETTWKAVRGLIHICNLHLNKILTSICPNSLFEPTTLTILWWLLYKAISWQPFGVQYSGTASPVGFMAHCRVLASIPNGIKACSEHTDGYASIPGPAPGTECCTIWLKHSYFYLQTLYIRTEIQYICFSFLYHSSRYATQG